jgi:hypothetical protein
MTCRQIHRRLPGYVDGAIHSGDHARIREHLESCAVCRAELNRYHQLSVSLARMEPVVPPEDLVARIRVRVSHERALHSRAWRLGSRAFLIFENILRPLAVPATGGLVTAVLVFILVVQSLLVGIPLGAVPNDLPTSLLQPARLESLAPFPVPGIGATGEYSDARVLMLEATLDAQGDVVHYDILSGPDTTAVRRQLDQVLLFSRFRPQLSFGRPIAGGRVLLLFSEVRVKG